MKYKIFAEFNWEYYGDYQRKPKLKEVKQLFDTKEEAQRFIDEQNKRMDELSCPALYQFEIEEVKENE